jgi:hypothetical protein
MDERKRHLTKFTVPNAGTLVHDGYRAGSCFRPTIAKASAAAAASSGK